MHSFFFILLFFTVIFCALYLQNILDDLRFEVELQTVLLRDILKKLEPVVTPRPAVSLKLTFEGKDTHMAQFPDTQTTINVVISGVVDAAGQPTTLDPASVAAWDLSDSSFGTITGDLNGAVVTLAPGKLGSFNVQLHIPAINAQPDLVASGTATIVPGAAASLSLTLS